jgi:electron transfer flavoprotein alpha subunit
VIADRPAPLLPLKPDVAEVITVDDDVSWCLVVPDALGGLPNDHDLDAIAAARVIADRINGGVIVCAPAGSTGWEWRGADRVVFHEEPEDSDTRCRIDLIEQLIEQFHPMHVFFPDTSTGGGHTARRLSARLGLQIATSVKRIDGSLLVRAADNDRQDHSLALTPIIAVLAEVAELDQRICRAAKPLPYLADKPAAGLPFQSTTLPPDSLTAPLAEMDFIVSGGAGVVDWEALKALASRLGAGLGATRAVCDSGTLARDRQIGVSGTLVRPRCYLSFGISGASQHLQGIVGCQRVVAVNIDLYADMVKRADLAIVADAQSVIDELLSLLGAKK